MPLSVVVPEGDAAYLRRLNNARERHVGERTALLNQMQQLVFLIFPEFKTVVKQMMGKTVRFILKNYTTPEKIGAPWIKKHSAKRCADGAWAGSA